MDKKILIIAGIIILLVIISAFFILQDFDLQPEYQKYYEQTTYRNSPFGMSGAISRPFVESDKINQADTFKKLSETREPYKYDLDLGIKWVRPGADIYWPMVQPNQEYVVNNTFDWKVVDVFYGRVPQDINILATIDALPWSVNNHWAFKPGAWEFNDKKTEKHYINFVREVVERYDGDGDKDMPGLKNPIKYWQIGNEPAVRPLTGIKDLSKSLDWEGFSHLVEITYKVIKENDPEAKIVLAGMAGGYPPDYADDPFIWEVSRREREEFFIKILQDFQGKYIDIFDIHYYGSLKGGIEGWQWEKIKNAYNVFRELLDKNGYKNTEIWITETAVPNKPFGESFQAINLIKRYIYPLSLGVKKVFWWNMIEGETPLEDNQPSDHFGLIYDGIGKDDPDYGTKKLSYYTYRKMIEILEGSDWNSIQKIQESNGIYVYKFIKQGKSIWVAWNDNSGEKSIMLDVNNKRVKITEAVPKYESGKEVTNYNIAFNTETKMASNGKITITLGDVPVFVEEE